MKIKLTNCPCSKQSTAFSDNGETAMCYTCGSKTIEHESVETLPNLYKDLIFEDNKQRKYIPCTINIKDEGIAFIDGTSTENVKWKVVKNISLTKEDEGKFPEGTLTKPDFSNTKEFDRYNFIDVLDEVGFFKK